jgi:hypothetical protein
VHARLERLVRLLVALGAGVRSFGGRRTRSQAEEGGGDYQQKSEGGTGGGGCHGIDLMMESRRMRRIIAEGAPFARDFDLPGNGMDGALSFGFRAKAPYNLRSASGVTPLLTVIP